MLVVLMLGLVSSVLSANSNPICDLSTTVASSWNYFYPCSCIISNDGLYKDPITKTIGCMTCDLGKAWHGYCATCPKNQYIHQSDKKCVPCNLPGQKPSANKLYCQSDVGKPLSVRQRTFEFDATSPSVKTVYSNRPACSDETPHFHEDTGKCERCPKGKVYHLDGEFCETTETCLNGGSTSINFADSTCHCNRNKGYHVYDHETHSCLKQCPAEMILHTHEDTERCIEIEHCKSDESLVLENNECACNVAHGFKYFNGITESCSKCDANQALSLSGECVSQSTCTSEPGVVYDYKHRTCFCNEKKGFNIHDSSTHQCLTECPDGTSFDMVKSTCSTQSESCTRHESVILESGSCSCNKKLGYFKFDTSGTLCTRCEHETAYHPGQDKCIHESVFEDDVSLLYDGDLKTFSCNTEQGYHAFSITSTNCIRCPLGQAYHPKGECIDASECSKDGHVYIQHLRLCSHCLSSQEYVSDLKRCIDLPRH